MSNIAIIGGGASGIMAAILAAENGLNSVTIYESGERIGRKILATGNGRCNMTNIDACYKDYHSADMGFVKAVIDTFWVKETLEIFKSLGVLYKVEEKGKVYPYSDQASAVLDVMRYALSRAGVIIKTKFEVESVKKNGNGFLITSYSGEKAYADKVVVATGGKAAPNLGSKGEGYEILKSFGHHITALKPSLVQIKTAPDIVKKLKGIKVNANVKMGRYEELGEVLFTDYGLSGPPIFSLSSRLENHTEIVIDIMPEYKEEKIIDMIWERISNTPDILLEDFFVGMLNKRVGQCILKNCGIVPLSREAYTLTSEEIETVAGVIKQWRFVIEDTMSWNNAQVTKGGVKVSEINETTMESKLVNGIYVTGELLDVDGDCGGYNLQWAWSTGYIAGKNCGKAENENA